MEGGSRYPVFATCHSVKWLLECEYAVVRYALYDNSDPLALIEDIIESKW